MRRRETDAEFLLRVLKDGRPHELNEILRRSFVERGCGLTVHSRASTLRERGHAVLNWTDGGTRRSSWYRLVGTLEEGSHTRAGDRDLSSSGPDEADGINLPGASPYQDDVGAARQLSLIPASRGAYGAEAA